VCSFQEKEILEVGDFVQIKKPLARFNGKCGRVKIFFEPEAQNVGVEYLKKKNPANYVLSIFINVED